MKKHFLIISYVLKLFMDIWCSKLATFKLRSVFRLYPLFILLKFANIKKCCSESIFFFKVTAALLLLSQGKYVKSETGPGETSGTGL